MDRLCNQPVWRERLDPIANVKRKIVITLGLVGLILGISLWQRAPKESPLSTPDIPVAAHSSAQQTGEAQKTNQTSDVSFLAKSNDVIQARSRLADLIRSDGEAKNIPLDFYGRVVDQDDKPLSKTRIDLRLRHWTTAYAGNSVPINLETDTSGLFHAHGATGDAFDIESISKADYELEPNTPRGFRAEGGSKDAPVIFKMWRSDVKEQLVEGTKSMALVPDGRVYSIDLKNGTITESGTGDLKVRIQRPAQITLGEKYDWSCQVIAENGGLLEETDAHSSMFMAPTNGYSQSFQFEQKVVGGWGNSTGPKRFFLNLGDGRSFGRISIEIWASYNSLATGRIRIQYVLNPSGSRILR